ncbi:hypothetical protein ACNAW0_16565 [Micromonospora sp. SL1-18]|uniref:hypothetical protein n=1 Tax=Micromonospora sp. SL1-18 TaxID=3399128 RepID=UPI003A4D2F69
MATGAAFLSAGSWVSEGQPGSDLGAKAVMGSRGTVTDSGMDDAALHSAQQPLGGSDGAETGRSALTRLPGWASAAIGPLATTGRRPLVWASWAAAAFCAAYIFWTMPSPLGVAFAIALPLLVLRLPLTGTVLVVVLTQEIKPNGRFGELTTLGYQVFFGTGKIPIVLPLALTAALAAAVRWWPPKRARLRSVGGALLGLAAALVVLAGGSGLLHGQSPFSAVNQNARAFILLVLGLVIGMSMRRLQDDQRSLRVTVGVALAGLLVAAAIAIPLGEIADDRLSSYFVYYDSALPAIAAAVFIGMLGAGGWRWDWRYVGVLVATPLLVLISFRRSVWIAALLALVVVLAFTWPRWKRMLRQFAFAVAAVAVVVFAAPGFAADLGLRSAGSFELASGGPSPSNAPSVTGASSPTGAPSRTGASSPTGAPSVTGPAGPTSVSSVAGPPSVTGAPTVSRAPSPSSVPSASRAPSANGTPKATDGPSANGTPKPTGAPSPSDVPSGDGGSARPTSAPDPTRPAPTAPNQESSAHQTASTGGHISDLRLGWDHVRANFWTGVGPLSPQLDGAAAHEATRVYVHNELLQVWLRYGPVAPLLVILFLLVAGLAALNALRDPDSDIIVRSAAVFCLIAPLCVMTAPFLSETSRWPLVMGIAAGILAGSAGASTKVSGAWSHGDRRAARA